jgi:hypothetical protein
MNKNKKETTNKITIALLLCITVFIVCNAEGTFNYFALKNKSDAINDNKNVSKKMSRDAKDDLDFTDSSFDLYLLIGQSNMAGRGLITEEFIDQQDPLVFMLNKENAWVPAKNPLHFDKPSIAGVGPGLSFGISMAKKNPAHKIGLIPCAVGGTSIDVWKPGAFDKATKTHPYDDMVVRLQEAEKSGVLKGIIWLQGESDSSPEKAALYLDKLKELIERIRTLAGSNSVPFVAGELGRYKDQYQNINVVLKQLPAQVSNTAIASSKGLKDKGDKTHFDSPSAKKMGERMAKKMIALQKRIS